MFIIMLTKQYSNIEEYVKYVLQIFVYIKAKRLKIYANFHENFENVFKGIIY
jgi:hypothetical protein